MFKGSFHLIAGLMGLILIVAVIMAIGLFWVIIGSIGLFIASIVYYILSIKSENPKQITISRILLIITTLFMVVVVLFTLTFFGVDIENPFDKSIWAKENTPIEEFDYYIDGTNIYLKSYNGKSKKLKIGSTYTVNNVDCNVVAFKDLVVGFKTFDSIILPEGLVSIPDNTFNCTHVKYLYIPSTLKKNDNTSKYFDDKSNFTDYLYGLEVLYYGGTEEQWNDLTNNTPRSEIGTKQIIFNAKVNELVE